MKRSVIIVLVVIVSLVKAQDRIILKNGIKVSGKITNFESGKTVSIVNDSSSFIFSSDEVKKMKLGSMYNESPLTKEKGFFNETSMGFMLGNNNYLRANGNFTFQMLNGYSFNNKFSLALGMGLESWTRSFKFPFYANARYYLRKSSLSPYIGASIGYTITSLNDDQNNNYYPHYDIAYSYYNSSSRNSRGLMLGGQLGVRKLISKNFGMSFATGFRYQRLVTYYDSFKDYEYLYRVEFRVGLLFK